jgi:hypothetical protein
LLGKEQCCPHPVGEVDASEAILLYSAKTLSDLFVLWYRLALTMGLLGALHGAGLVLSGDMSAEGVNYSELV